MISTATDFNKAVEDVSDRLDPINVEIGTKMASSTFNNHMRTIQGHIQQLYEKLRILEDIHSYVNDRINTAIDSRQKKLADQMRVIRESVDDFMNTDRITVNISFDRTSQYIEDRDGYSLPLMDNVRGELVMPGVQLGLQKVKSVMSTGQQMTAELFNEDVLRDLNNQPFRSIHESYQPVPGGLECSYEINFSPVVWCNYVDLSPVNCDIVSCTIISTDGAQLEIDLDNLYQRSLNVEIATMLLTVRCSDYETLDLEFPQVNNDSFDNSLTGRET